MKRSSAFHLFVMLSLFSLSLVTARADEASREQKASQASQSLQQDLVDLPDDTSRISRDRKNLREDYQRYTDEVKSHGHGTKPARRAAKKVLAAQAALHQDEAKEAARVQRRQAAAEA